MKLGIMLIVTMVGGACGSVNSPVTEDAAPGNDAPSNPHAPGELV